MTIFEIDVDFEIDAPLAFWVYAPTAAAATDRLNDYLSTYEVAAYTSVTAVAAVPAGVSTGLVLH